MAESVLQRKRPIALGSDANQIENRRKNRLTRFIKRLFRDIGSLTHRFNTSANRQFRKWCVASRFGMGIFYAFRSPAYHREQHSLLAGFFLYERDQLDANAEVRPLLRRNTHRLEKGLLMRPRRDVFAADYIGETVASFEIATKTRRHYGPSYDKELQWANDVIRQYFSVVANHPKIEEAREQFFRIDLSQFPATDGLVPYQRDLESPSRIGYEDLKALAHKRRSVRWFLDKPVPREMIDRALEIAAQSPSACNRQPFVFHVIDDPKLLKQVVEIPMGTAGYAENIPVFVVIVGQQRNYFDERDRHLIYIDGSLAAMSFLFGLEVQGLSSCCVNWPEIEEKEVRMAELLGLDDDERPVMCIALGYPDPDGMVAYSQKKPLRQLRRYNLTPESVDQNLTFA